MTVPKCTSAHTFTAGYLQHIRSGGLKVLSLIVEMGEVPKGALKAVAVSH